MCPHARLLLFFGLLPLAHFASAQRHPVQFVEWPASHATVFAAGAWVEHTGTATPPASEFELVIDGVSTQLDPRSIQAELPDSWRLVGTQFSIGVRPELSTEVEQAIARIEEEIKAMRTTTSMREALFAVYAEELLMIQANRQLSHQETLLVEDMQDAADFWRNRVKELKYKQLELSQELADIQVEIAALEAEIREQRNRLSKPSGQIHLRLSAQSTRPESATVRYLTQAAQWLPEYDVSIDASGAILFDRYAAVSQTSGEDWDAIPVEFVVGNPLSTLAPPAFERWILKEQTAANRSKGTAYESVAFAPAMFSDFISLDDDMRSGNLSAEPTQVFSTDRFRFEPVIRPFISGSGESERVFIESFELQGDLNYLLMPYASDEAYQLATSDQWTTSRLMPGRVQVEAGGAFRGWFDLMLPAPGDTLVVPIGQDPEVRSSRERLADRCSTTAFGGKNKSEQTWVIEVENQHDRPIEARVEDRIPVAFRPDIVVELLESSGAKHDSAYGKLTWNVTLQPGERRTFTVRYRIEYPKGLSITNF